MTKFPDSEYLKHKGHYPKYGSIFTAMFVDLLFVNCLAFVVIKIYSLIFGPFLDRYTLSYIGFGLYVLCLFTVPVLSAKSCTLGQKVTGIRLRMANGEKMSVPTAIIRWISSIFSFVGYGSKRVPSFDRKNGTVCIKLSSAQN